MINCILSGVGGQGTILASKLLAQSAMNQGEQARTAETIGMAQRGGCVISHVRMGGQSRSPMIPHGSADVVIGFEPAEAVRCLSFLKEGGIVIVAKKAIKPVTASLSGSDYDGVELLAFLQASGKRVIVVDGESICRRCGSSKVLNVALLGAAAASGALGISLEQMEKAIEDRVPARFWEMNKQALYAGAEGVL